MKESTAFDYFASPWPIRSKGGSSTLRVKLRKEISPLLSDNDVINLFKSNYAEQELKLKNPANISFYNSVTMNDILSYNTGHIYSDCLIRLHNFSVRICDYLNVSKNVFQRAAILATLSFIKGELDVARAILDTFNTANIGAVVISDKCSANGRQGGRNQHPRTGEAIELAEKRHKEVPYESNEQIAIYVVGKLKEANPKEVPSLSTVKRAINTSQSISKSRLKASKSRS